MTDSVVLINHSTALIQIGGVNVLTDPIYSWTVSYLFPRMQKPGIAFEDLPAIDFVLVSHSDYDHLNLKTLRRLSRRNTRTIVFPHGLRQYGERSGFQEIVELKRWDAWEHKGARITCVPAKHLSKRKPGDPTSTFCSGFVIQAGGRTIYFAGDTAYGDFFTQIGTRFDIDVALLPIGAYKPEKWFKNLHLHPETALQAFRDLRAHHLIPIHWGTFWISDEPMAEPPQKLLTAAESAGLREKIQVLRNGQSFRLP